MSERESLFSALDRLYAADAGSDEALSAYREIEREMANARRTIWWLVRAQPGHKARVYPTMHRDSEMELVRYPLVSEDGWEYRAAVVYGATAE